MELGTELNKVGRQAGHFLQPKGNVDSSMGTLRILFECRVLQPIMRAPRTIVNWMQVRRTDFHVLVEACLDFNSLVRPFSHLLNV